MKRGKENTETKKKKQEKVAQKNNTETKKTSRNNINRNLPL